MSVEAVLLAQPILEKTFDRSPMALSVQAIAVRRIASDDERITALEAFRREGQRQSVSSRVSLSATCGDSFDARPVITWRVQLDTIVGNDVFHDAHLAGHEAFTLSLIEALCVRF